VLQFGVYNYTQGFSFIWNELSVTVTGGSDWEAAREIMLSLAQETAAIVEQQVSKQILRMSREYLVHYSILTPFVYVRVVPEGVCLSLRYLCEVRKRRGTEHALTVSMLKAFREHGRIELAADQGSAAQPEKPAPERKGPLPRTFG
jgi:small-conductance mechanosensitive channel